VLEIGFVRFEKRVIMVCGHGSALMTAGDVVGEGDSGREGVGILGKMRLSTTVVPTSAVCGERTARAGAEVLGAPSSRDAEKVRLVDVGDARRLLDWDELREFFSVSCSFGR
jgi:hypothetical protein